MAQFQSTYPNFPVGSGIALRLRFPVDRAVGIAAGSGQITYTGPMQDPAVTPYVEPGVESAYHAARTANAAEEQNGLTKMQLAASIIGSLLSLGAAVGVVYLGVKWGTRAARR